MQMGIVGLPNVGKSTLFKALTKKEVTIANYPFATIDPNVGVVPIPDERIEKLAELSHSKKTVPTVIEFVDIAGLVKGASEGQGLGNAFLSHIRDVDAILHVVRVFNDPNIIHVDNTPNPARDFETICLELVLKDLDTVKKALEKAESEARSQDKIKVRRRDEIKALHDILESGKLLSQASLNAGQGELTRELGLITGKRMLVLFNVSERELSKKWDPDSELRSALGTIPYLAVPVGIEADAVEMSEDDAASLRELAGIRQTALNSLIQKSYELLGLISFFTTGEDETRAWTIPKGSKAPRAGRAIHSDFEERFIRAEVVFWEDLIRSGSWARARDQGLLRTEGREYEVKDGDVIEFRI